MQNELIPGTDPAPVIHGAQRTKRAHKETELPMGAPCVICHQCLGAQEKGHTASGFDGHAHPACIRNAMPVLARRATAILEACERKWRASYHETLGMLAPFQRATASDKLRKMTPQEFATLLTTTFTTLHGLCNNGLSGMRAQITGFAATASRRLFCEVTVVKTVKK